MDCVFLYRLETRLRGLCASWEAEIMGRQFAAHPSWLLNIPPDETVNIQEVRLRGRSALLIEDSGENGKGERATIVLHTAERVYAVSSKTREQSIRIADALP